jgi:hypothetical protein
MLLEKVKGQLRKDAIQRVIYGIGLTIWTYLMWDSITDFPYETSSLGINYMTLFTFPAILLFLQIIRNNKLLWGLIFGLVTIYIFIALYLVIADAIERSGNHVKAIDWESKDVLILLTVFGVLLIADWTIYAIRPKRLI